MTSRMLIIDDRTGHRIPAGARYFQVQTTARPFNTYRDIRAVSGVMDELRAALRVAEETPGQSIHIEIHERTA